MSIQLTPLTDRVSAGAARRRTGGTSKKTMNAEPAGHHPRKAPHGHLCSCGRLRDECVRDTVRAMWS